MSLLERAGLRLADITISRFADVRYIGQGHEVRVSIPAGTLGTQTVAEIIEGFERVYRELYGRVVEANGLETVNWRVNVRGPKPSLDLRRRSDALTSDARKALKDSRPVYLPDINEYRSTPVYDRYRLGPGATFAGPAIVEERESTTVVDAAATATVDEYLNLVVRR